MPLRAVITPKGPDPAVSTVRARWNSFALFTFERDEDIADRDVLGRLLTGLGQDPEARLAEATSERTKQRLREQTDRARELGIFGAPSFTVGGDLYWGNDRLEEALDVAAKVRSTPGGACGFPNDF